MGGPRKSGRRTAILGAGLAALLALAGGLAPRSRAQEPAEEAKGFLRCPECGLEFPANNRKTVCPRCGQKRVVMEFSTTAGGAGKDFLPSGLFPMVMAGVAAVLGGALVVLSRRRAREQAEARPPGGPSDAERQETVRWQQELRRSRRGRSRR
jgi:DNA-directed RNA polymerase subunit RPC12/RpoP